MIDLSNNNGPVNFHKVRHDGHQVRAYLKLSEGTGFHDPDFSDLYHRAQQNGIRVGAYHFARPSRNTPREEADFFLRLLPKLTPGKTLRPCLDLEDPQAAPGPRIAAWAEVFIELVYKAVGWHALLYGSSSYVAECAFNRPPTYLWLASYGRNDGKEHPFAIPKPWTASRLAAHQYASTAHVPGVSGQVDISRVLRPRLIDVRRLRLRK